MTIVMWPCMCVGGLIVSGCTSNDELWGVILGCGGIGVGGHVLLAVGRCTDVGELLHQLDYSEVKCTCTV